MPDDQFLAAPNAFLLEPPIGVPEPAPLDMPRRQLQRFPVDVTRLTPRMLLLGRRLQRSQAG